MLPPSLLIQCQLVGRESQRGLQPLCPVVHATQRSEPRQDRGLLGEAHMLDLIIRGGTLIDGTGAPKRTADVGVTDGKIVETGRIDGSATNEIDADGALVTPGFVDIHTHY